MLKILCPWQDDQVFQGGLCGWLDNDEPRTVAEMDRYIEEQGYEHDFSRTRMHHEIYLSDPRKVQPEKYRTVIRHPIRKK